jgi:uncharacterized cupin superfamily protein
LRQDPIAAESTPGTMGQTIYPAPYTELVKGRLKRKLGDVFGLTNFGVNLTHLQPGSASALAHSHSQQDEFIFVISGSPTLVLAEKEFILKPGDCCGFKAGLGVAHHLVNRSTETVTYLEIGDRTLGDQVDYPDADLSASQLTPGVWTITHKDGSPYLDES